MSPMGPNEEKGDARAREGDMEGGGARQRREARELPTCSSVPAACRFDLCVAQRMLDRGMCVPCEN
jgi:hypothetical protein